MNQLLQSTRFRFSVYVYLRKLEASWKQTNKWIGGLYDKIVGKTFSTHFEHGTETTK